MSMNIDHNIDADMIMSVTKFEPQHPVYRLDYFGGTRRIVLKGENCHQNQVSGLENNVHMAAAVDHSSAGVLLSDIEKKEIITTFNDQSPANVVRFKGGDALDLCTVIATQNSLVWTKLPMIEKLTALDGAVKKLTTDRNKEGVRAFSAALNAPGGCEKLGEIVAFDLFIENYDRFDPDSPPNGYEALRNAGNVFVAASGDGTLSPVLLDTWQPGNLAADLSQSMDLDSWIGRHLKDEGFLKEYARRIVRDLNKDLGVRNRNGVALFFGASKERLESQTPMRIFNGIKVGVKKIRQKLAADAKANDKAWPPSLKDRITFLGWSELL